MVGVAQLVEHLVVVQVVAGSSPVTHPKARAICVRGKRGPGRLRHFVRLRFACRGWGLRHPHPLCAFASLGSVAGVAVRLSSVAGVAVRLCRWLGSLLGSGLWLGLPFGLSWLRLPLGFRLWLGLSFGFGRWSTCQDARVKSSGSLWFGYGVVLVVTFVVGFLAFAVWVLSLVF